MNADARRASWVDVWRALDVSDPDPAIFAELLARYSEPHRAYHTLQHLDECLDGLARACDSAEHPAEIAIALWFHDAIYDAHRHDNEKRSADWARQALLAAGVAPDVAQRIHALVMTTRHDVQPDGRRHRSLDPRCAAGALAEYERQIRIEYAHVPPALFEPRRRAILQRFLERRPLYRTAAMRSAREEQAQINLRRAVDAAASASSSVDDLLGLALRLVNAGQRAQARMLCEQAMATHSPHPAVLQLLALLIFQDGDLAHAREQAARSLALRPDHGPTLALAGDVARAAHAPAEAVAHCERAHALEPDRPERRQALGVAHFELALLLQDEGDLPGAADALRQALRLMPQHAEAEVNLGIVLQQSGNLDGAMQAYGRAYRLREDTLGRIAHALAAADTGRLWLDLDALRHALRTAPSA